MLEFAEYLKIIVSLLAILDPIGAIPVFIGLTLSETPKQRLNTVNLVAFGVCIVLLVTLFFGEWLLRFFGISIASFRTGGGILVLLMAISMLQARTSLIKQTQEEANESLEKASVAIVPLAMPLLAGPGAISAVILAAHKSNHVLHYVVIAGGIILLSGIVWLCLRVAPWIAARIGATGINIFTRIMGLILAAIAIEYIANGLKGLFPLLAGSSG
jgi:multiple antibiotic resistance protein